MAEAGQIIRILVLTCSKPFDQEMEKFLGNGVDRFSVGILRVMLYMATLDRYFLNKVHFFQNFWFNARRFVEKVY